MLYLHYVFIGVKTGHRRSTMTEQIIKVQDRIKRLGSQIIEKAQNYTLERLVWCIAAIFMCWTQVQNYHEYIY